MKQQKINYIKKVNIYKEKFPLWAVLLFKSVFITFIICCAFVAVFSFIYTCTPVDGKSMLPTLNVQKYDDLGEEIESAPKDSVYINRFAEADYSDIIVMVNPNASLKNRYVIKRLIAKGGDKVGIGAVTSESSPAYRTYKVFLIKKGTNVVEVLDEPYLAEGTDMYFSFCYMNEYRRDNEEKFQEIETSFGDVWFLSVAENELFYLGDNRHFSLDCSTYGAQSKDNYVGRVDIIAYESKDYFSYIFLYFWHKIFG